MKAIAVNKSKGQVLNTEEIVQQVKFWLSDAAPGVYTLVFDKAKKPRSNDQNKLMWVWFTCLGRSWSEASGQLWTPQNVHDYYCKKFLLTTLPNGSSIPGSSSRLNSEEFTEFLNKVQADAATEFGITLLSISDPMYELWSKQYVNY